MSNAAQHVVSIGLSAATGLLLAEQVTGRPTSLSLAAFAPDRFAAGGSP